MQKSQTNHRQQQQVQGSPGNQLPTKTAQGQLNNEQFQKINTPPSQENFFPKPSPLQKFQSRFWLRKPPRPPPQEIRIPFVGECEYFLKLHNMQKQKQCRAKVNPSNSTAANVQTTDVREIRDAKFSYYSIPYSDSKIHTKCANQY